MKGRDHIIALEAISYIGDLAWEVEKGTISLKEIKERINQIHYTVDFLKECYIDTITGANKI